MNKNASRLFEQMIHFATEAQSSCSLILKCLKQMQRFWYYIFVICFYTTERTIIDIIKLVLIYDIFKIYDIVIKL